MVHPVKAQDMIQKGVAAALRNLKAYKPYKPSPPYKLEIVFTDENLAQRASWVPGASRTGERSVAFASNDFMDIVKYFRLARL
jgi:D-aminopeptidase